MTSIDNFLGKLTDTNIKLGLLSKTISIKGLGPAWFKDCFISFPMLKLEKDRKLPNFILWH